MNPSSYVKFPATPDGDRARLTQLEADAADPLATIMAAIPSDVHLQAYHNLFARFLDYRGGYAIVKPDAKAFGAIGVLITAAKEIHAVLARYEVEKYLADVERKRKDRAAQPLERADVHA